MIGDTDNTAQQIGSAKSHAMECIERVRVKNAIIAASAEIICSTKKSPDKK